MTGHDARRGVEWVELWDGRCWPGRVRNGLPEFGFKQAPSGLATRRQLRERGLSRGGQEPFARLVWKRDQRFAWLYVEAKARPKRTPSDKQLAAVDKALAARKVCAECGPVEHFVRTTDRLCGDCYAAGVQPTPAGTSTWQTLHEWEQTDPDDQDDEDDQGDQADAADADADAGVGRDQHEVEESPRRYAAAAVQRAAETVERVVSRAAADAQVGAERDEELARWHEDDQAARDRAAEAAAHDTTTSQDWPDLGRGAA